MNDWLAVRNTSTHFLHGHYPISVESYSRELLELAPIAGSPDRYGQGEFLQSFEKEIAELFGFEDCLFLQSGTMAQLIALRIWADKNKNSLIAFHPTSHLQLHEQMAYRELHQLQATQVGGRDRLITMDDLAQMNALPGTFLYELPQREIGGQLPSWQSLVEQLEILRAQGVTLHLDGARVWECAPFYQKSYREIAGLFDSIYVSFYKGIGAVSGAALLGSADFIMAARVWNRRHGGNLVTAFPVYLSASYNLQKRLSRFASYFAKTKEIVEGLIQLPGIQITPNPPQVNMFHLLIAGREDKLKERAMRIARERKIWGFAHLQAAETPGYCKLEWYVGDGALDLPTQTIVEYVSELCDPR